MNGFLGIKKIKPEKDKTSHFISRIEEVNRINLHSLKAVHRLQRMVAQKRRPFFLYDCEDGVIDISRFPRIVTNPTITDNYKKLVDGQVKSSVVCFIVDPSVLQDKMLRENVAGAVDMAVSSLEAADIATEVYSYDSSSIWCYKNSNVKYLRSKATVSMLLDGIPEVNSNQEKAIDRISKITACHFEENKVIIILTSKLSGFGFYKKNSGNITYSLISILNEIKSPIPAQTLYEPQQTGARIAQTLADTFGLKLKI